LICFNFFSFICVGEKDAPISALLGFLLGLAVLNACFFLGSVALAALITVSVVLAVLIIFINLYIIIRREIFVGVAFLIGAVMICIGVCISSYYYYTVQRYKDNQIKGIPVIEAANFSTYDVYYFTDGMVNVPFMGEYATSTSRGSRTYYCAAPVTYTSWQASSPVTLWAFCSIKSPCQDAYKNRASDCLTKWDEPILSGVRVEGITSTSANAAVKNAIKSFGLYDALNSPRIYWSLPESIFSQWELYFRICILLPNVIWLALLAITLPCYIYTKMKNRWSHSLELD